MILDLFQRHSLQLYAYHISSHSLQRDGSGENMKSALALENMGQSTFLLERVTAEQFSTTESFGGSKRSYLRELLLSVGWTLVASSSWLP